MYVVFFSRVPAASGCGRKHHLEIPRVDDEPLLAARVEHRFSCLFWFRISPDGGSWGNKHSNANGLRQMIETYSSPQG